VFNSNDPGKGTRTPSSSSSSGGDPGKGTRPPSSSSSGSGSSNASSGAGSSSSGTPVECYNHGGHQVDCYSKSARLSYDANHVEVNCPNLPPGLQ